MYNIVYGCILCLTLFLLFIAAKESKLGFFELINLCKLAFVIPIIIYFLSIPLFWFLRKKDYLDRAYNKVAKDFSKEVANKMLTPGKLTKITLINTRHEDYKDFILNVLPDKADFYVVLGEKDNLITIYLRFKTENKNHRLDVLTKEEFSTYCKIDE